MNTTHTHTHTHKAPACWSALASAMICFAWYDLCMQCYMQTCIKCSCRPTDMLSHLDALSVHADLQTCSLILMHSDMLYWLRGIWLQQPNHADVLSHLEAHETCSLAYMHWDISSLIALASTSTHSFSSFACTHVNNFFFCAHKLTNIQFFCAHKTHTHSKKKIVHTRAQKWVLCKKWVLCAKKLAHSFCHAHTHKRSTRLLKGKLRCLRRCLRANWIEGVELSYCIILYQLSRVLHKTHTDTQDTHWHTQIEGTQDACSGIYRAGTKITNFRY